MMITIPEDLQEDFSLFFHSYHSFFDGAKDIIEKNDPSHLELDGLIHRAFVLMFLAVELIKSYLKYKGIYKSNIEDKQVISLAYKQGIIKNEDVWHLASEKLQFIFFTSDDEIFKDLLYFIDESFQGMMIELCEYFAVEFDLQD